MFSSCACDWCKYAVWTTATLYCSECLTSWYVRYRTLPLASSREHLSSDTYDNFTDVQSTDEWSLTSPASWFTCYCLAKHRRVCRMTFILSQKVVFVGSDHQLTNVLSHFHWHKFYCCQSSSTEQLASLLLAQHLNYDLFKCSLKTFCLITSPR